MLVSYHLGSGDQIRSSAKVMSALSYWASPRTICFYNWVYSNVRPWHRWTLHSLYVYLVFMFSLIKCGFTSPGSALLTSPLLPGKSFVLFDFQLGNSRVTRAWKIPTVHCTISLLSCSENSPSSHCLHILVQCGSFHSGCSVTSFLATVQQSRGTRACLRCSESFLLTRSFQLRLAISSRLEDR